ncbi:hypothetical protein HCC61_26555 [Streptomyces sp. HNM0575]|nr:hypothetical protein [Streptomyces sp. HNM0575]
MNSAPQLLPEDRPEFERAVDEALREAGRRPALAAVGEQISAGQLRVMALSAASAIAAEAAEEYGQYVALRTRLREEAVEGSRASAGPKGRGGSAAAGSRAGSEDDGEQRGGGGGLSLAGVGEGVGETSGAGLLAMVSVLVPLLAGTAAVIFLLLGYLLRVLSPEPSIAAPMRGAGWVFAVLAAAGIVVAMAELWLTALRNGAGARRGAPMDAGADAEGREGDSRESRLAREVSDARVVWRDALLEHGIVPFLADALAAQPGGQRRGGDGTESAHGAAGSSAAEAADGPDTTATSRTPSAQAPSSGSVTEASRAEERTPRLGYSGPDFSSRSPSDGKDPESVRPRYSSPDYSSPDYGGPEHKPE